MDRKVIVIGSGPAGLTAALYLARANLYPLVITGLELGGQVSITTEVENYPGFPEGLTGPELVELMKKQAGRFGTEFEFDEVIQVDLGSHPFRLSTHGNQHTAQALIIASGAFPRRLGVPGEQEFTGRGVSYCATCDGFFFRDKEIVVVGGGDSALEEGLFLTKFARVVRVIHRRDQLRAGANLQARARRNPKMEFVWNTVVSEITGNGKVEAVKLKDVRSGETSLLPTDGVFVYVGHLPNTGLFVGQLELDERGYLVSDRRTRTSVPGVFAAGEVADPLYRQVVTSAGFGCMAALEAEKFMAQLEDRAYPGTG